MVAPFAIDLQILPHIAFIPEIGLFKEPDGTLVVRNTGSFNPVQPQDSEDIGNGGVEAGQNEAAPGCLLGIQ